MNMSKACKHTNVLSHTLIANICERSPLFKAPYLQINQETSSTLLQDHQVSEQ